MHQAVHVDISDMVAYQKGSIISKEIVRRGSGAVTLFAFDQAQGLRRCTTSVGLLLRVLEGVTRVTVSEEVHHLKEGEAIIMPAETPYAVMAVKKSKMMMVALH